ncbi:MAG: hypothetical protein J6R88_05770 [Clostridia bacterium]|nr:hypothetical protein [Clostridia bacterium]
MDILELLKARKAKLFEATADVRKKIFELVDENSFVELGAYTFAKNEFFEEDIDGLGVVTGYATLNDYPVYIVAQNGKVLSGGLSKANCKKIADCLIKAASASAPVIYLMDTQGVQVGEGVAVLEGIANVLSVADEIKGEVPQFAIATGDVYGSSALLFAQADYTYVVGASTVAYTSPAVISASSKDGVSKEVIGGAKATNGVNSFAVKSLDEVGASISAILGVLPSASGLVVDTTDDLNRASIELNTKKDAKALIKAVFDNGEFIELNKGDANVITGIGRVGGISSAAIVFDGGENGVELTLESVLKIENFAAYVANNKLPLLTFVNNKGIKADVLTASTSIMREIPYMLSTLAGTRRISVVYGKAIGFGYSAFASREFGNEYTFAFADAKISILDGDAGAAVEFGTIDPEKLEDVKEKYAESQDAFNAAKLGCVDNIIENQFVRQYVISALEMLIN